MKWFLSFFFCYLYIFYAILNSKWSHVVFPRAGIGDRRNGLTLCQVEKQLPFRYFEIRGKKNPQWGSRGKFVGVRGKKWATAPYEDSSSFMSVFDNIERIGMDADSSAILGNLIGWQAADWCQIHNVFLSMLRLYNLWHKNNVSWKYCFYAINWSLRSFYV